MTAEARRADDRRNGPWDVALCALSGGLYGAAFPPWSCDLLAWVALVPLLVVSTRVRPRVAFIDGIVFGGAVSLVTGWWFAGMVSRFFDVSQAVGVASFVAVAVLMAGVYFGLFAAWTSAVVRWGCASPLVVGVGWCAMEFVRARLFVGNPWALSAYSQVDHLALSQIADTTGPYGVALLVGWANATVAAIGAAALRGRHPRRSASLLAVAVAASWFYGTWRLQQPLPSGADVRVRVVQSQTERGAAWRPEYAALGLDEQLRLTLQSGPAPALVIWPEGALNFYPQRPSPLRVKLLVGAQRTTADMLLGAPSYRLGANGFAYGNAVFLVRGSRIIGRYDKRHLLPAAETTLYEPGTTAGVLSTKAGRVGPLVCFEAMYPELARETVAAGATILVNLSNDRWFDAPGAAAHHLAIARLRAIETRRYLVRAAAGGFSAVIDPSGRLSALAPYSASVVLDSVVAPSTIITVHQRVGDLLGWLALLTCGGIALHALLAATAADRGIGDLVGRGLEAATAHRRRWYA